jgi:hypothetical protein
MQRNLRLPQPRHMMRPGTGVDGDDDAAKAGGIERLGQIDEHGLRAAAPDAMDEVQHGRTLVHRGRAGQGRRGRESTQALPGRQRRSVSRAERDRPHIIDIALRQLLLQSLRVSKAPETVASASQTDSGEP